MCLGVETVVSGCVVAPSEAEPTSSAYLASAPRLTFGAGGCQPARRAARSASVAISRRARVDDDAVAFVQQRDRAAARGFRRDVADHEAVGGAAEAAVGDQRDVVAEAAADQRGGDAEHLAHAGAAGRTFVADHDHVAGLAIAPCLHGGERVLPRSRTRAPCLRSACALAGKFQDAAFRREIAVQDRVAAARLERA